MKSYVGDFRAGDNVTLKFHSYDSTGAPIALSGGTISVYKEGSVTQSTAGVTLTASYDSITGLNDVAIDTSADGTFYAAGNDFHVVVTAGTVNSISVVGYVVGHFSIENRSALLPTTAGRKLDVSAGGEAGVDWANVGSPTTTVGLSGTTVKTATDVETDTADIQSRIPAALVSGRIDASVGAMASNTLTAAAIATDAGAEIADAVLDELLSGHTTSGSLGAVVTLVRQFLQNRIKHNGTTVTLYADDGTTPLLTWQAKDNGGTALNSSAYGSATPAERTAAS